MNKEVNWVSQSWMTFWGIPCRWKTWSLYRHAIPSEISSVYVGTRCVCLLNQSIKTQMVLNPFDSGSSPIRSTETVCQGPSDVSCGCKRAVHFFWLGLVHWQTSQPFTYLSTSFHMSGQWYSLHTKSKVFLIPEWPVSRLLWWVASICLCSWGLEDEVCPLLAV